MTTVDLYAIKNYWFTWGAVAGVPNVLIARTGYSGEDGFELYLPADEAAAVKVWNELLAAGQEFGIRPCGLGARNTLRLEAGMSLYGHEISETINVFEAGLDRWLKLDKGDFIGRQALQAIQAAGGPARKLVGLEMIDRGIARDGYSVLPRRRTDRHGDLRLPRPIPQNQHCLRPGPHPGLPVAKMSWSRSAKPLRARQVPPFYKRPKP